MTDAELAFRCLYHRAQEVAVELVRAAEGAPETFQRMHHTKNACLRLAELAAGLGYDLTPRMDEDEDEDREPEPPTFDEALAAKCDAEARNDEAMRVKGMLG